MVSVSTKYFDVTTIRYKEKDGGRMDLSVGAFGIHLSGDLKLLMTDYDTYAVTWTCVSIPIFGPVEIIWIASR